MHSIIRRIATVAVSMRAAVCPLLILLGIASGCSHPHSSTEPEPDIDPLGLGIPRSVDTEPSWNPAGTAVVYVHSVNEPGPFELRILDLETGATTDIGKGLDPKWSPDGTKIASCVYGILQVYDIATNTWTPLRQDGRSFFPSWSWDSKRIVFKLASLGFGEVGPAGGIWEIDLDSGQQVRILSQPGTNPCWVPNDSVLVFGNGYPNDSHVSFEEIAKFDFETREITRLTNDVFDNRDLAISPDGSKIAWFGLSSSKDVPSGIYVSPLAGGPSVLLDTLGQQPAWSRDGSRIAYAGYNRDSNSYTLWTMNPDGSGKRRLTAP